MSACFSNFVGQTAGVRIDCVEQVSAAFAELATPGNQPQLAPLFSKRRGGYKQSKVLPIVLPTVGALPYPFDVAANLAAFLV